jgi:hypothetical protein
MMTWHRALGLFVLTSLGACTTATVTGGPGEAGSSLPNDMVTDVLRAQSVQSADDDVCASCNDAISGVGLPLCTGNGPPSSSDLLDGLVACICTDGCAAECAGACSGQDDLASDACMVCIENTCNGAIAACTADVSSTPPPPSDPPPSDPPPPSAACSTCSDFLTGVSHETPCTDDGPPSSYALYGDFIDCVCTTGCSAECGAACNGLEDPTDACYSCLYTTCDASIEACLGEPFEPEPPPPPPPPPSCSTCNDFLTGVSSETPCTDDGPPSSYSLYGDFIDCVCTTGCSAECGAACDGLEDPTDACYSCLSVTCDPQIQACLSH